MSHSPQLESPRGGVLEEIVTFVVTAVEAARDWIASLWSPAVPTSEPTQLKDALVTSPQRDESSTSPKGSVEEPDIGTTGNTEDSSALPSHPTDTAVQSQEVQLSHRDLDATSVPNVGELSDEVPLVQDHVLGQAEPTAAIHETAAANEDWVSLSKPDVESLSIKASDDQPDPTTTSFVPPQHETPQPQPEGSPQQQETTLESTFVDTPIIVPESEMSTGSDTSSPLLSTPEPDTQSFDAAVHIQTDAENQVPFNPESNVEVGSVSEIKARTSTPSLNDSASNSINRAGAGSPSDPTKKKRGGSFIKKQTTLMTKVFKTKYGSSDNGNGKDSLTSPSLSSLTPDNHSIASSLVSEPEAMEKSTPAPYADTPTGKNLASASRVSFGSIGSMSGSIKKKFGRRSGIASNKDISSSVSTSDQESLSEPLDLPSKSSQPSKVADAANSSLLKNMFKVRQPSKIN